MKKVISVLLAILMMMSMLSIAAVAAEPEVPLVVLQGYSGPTLVYVDEDGNPIIDSETGDVKKAWPLDFGKIGEQVTALIPDIIGGADIVETLLPLVRSTLAPLERNLDGSSIYNLAPYPSGAANTQVSVLKARGQEEYIPEDALVAMAETHLSDDMIFGFTYDWRKGQVEYAAALDEYIQEVKEITGADQVDIFGLSHGGQYGTSYLYYYGYKGDVRKAIFANPATLGTTIVDSIFTGEYLDFDVETLVRFIQHGFEEETNWEWLTMLLSLDGVVEGVNKVLQDPDILQGLMSIGSLWDFVTEDTFEAAMEYAESENPATGKPAFNIKGSLYTNTWLYHSTRTEHESTWITKCLADVLKDLQADGLQVGYIVGYDYGALNGHGNNSDYIIDTYLSSGADCALLGETFPAGYEQKGTVCDDESHYHISPDFNIDASTGFAPDSTWYIKGQGHGMYMHDEYSAAIVEEFLWGDLVDVYSDKNFPQFNFSKNDSETTYMSFNNTSVGYHSTKDTALCVKNMSVDSSMVIWNIEAVGADITFNYSQGMQVTKGKVVNLAIKNNNFNGTTKPFAINITYTLTNMQMTSVTDTFVFMPVSNDELTRCPHLKLVTDINADDTGDDSGEGLLGAIGGVLDNIGGIIGGGNGDGGSGDGSGDTPSTGLDGVLGGLGDFIGGIIGGGGEQIPDTSSGRALSITSVAVIAGLFVVLSGVMIKKREEE